MGRARKRKQQDRDVPPAAAAEKAGSSSLPRRFPVAAVLAPLLVVLVGSVTYANSFSIPFLFDDYFAIVGNPEVKSLEPIGKFFSQSRGLAMLLDALNYRWGGENVWGYHCVNVAVHLLNALLVYGLSLLTLRLPVHEGRYDSASRVLALVIALVFVAHPLQTMAVSYIVQRAESLAAMFYLIAVLLFAASRSGWIGIGGGALGAVLLAVGFFGIISKETVASLPAALLLYWVCFLRDRKDRRARPGWGLALLAALPALYGIYLARHFLLPGFGEDGGQSSWMYIPSAGLGVEGVTPGRYLMTQFGVIVWYLRLFVLPTRLTFDYGWPFADSFWSTQVLLPLAVLVAMVALALWAFARYRWATFAIGWLFVTLAPSSSIIPIKDAAFEYRMYLPMYGLIVLAVVGAFDAIGRFSASRRAARSAERIALAAAVVWITALAVGTAVRNETLQDPLALARDSAAKAPNNWRNQFGLGAALVEVGRTDEAIEPFERSIAINPEQGTSRIMLGDIYARAGRLEEAETILLPATDVREESVAAGAYRQLGFLYKAQNYPAAAIAMFEQALERKPSWHSLDLQIVRLLRYQGDFHDAAVRLNQLTREVPSYAGSLSREIAQTNLLGGVQSFELGEPDFAKSMLAIAMGDAKTFPAAAHYLAYVESRMGNDSEALRLLSDLERRGMADSAALANLERARAGEDLVAPTTSAHLARG